MSMPPTLEVRNPHPFLTREGVLPASTSLRLGARPHPGSGRRRSQDRYRLFQLGRWIRRVWLAARYVPGGSADTG